MIINPNDHEKKNNAGCIDYLSFILDDVKMITKKEDQLKGYDFEGKRNKSKYTVDAKVVDLLSPSTRKAFLSRGIQFSFEVEQKTKEDPNGLGWGMDPHHAPTFILWVLDGPDIRDPFGVHTDDYSYIMMLSDTFKKMGKSLKIPLTEIKNKKTGEYSGTVRFLTLHDIRRWEEDNKETIIVDFASKKQVQKRLKGLNK